MSYQLNVLPDMLGQITDSRGNFPVFVKEDTSDSTDDYSRKYTNQYHWHPDLEFIYYISGSNEFFINGSSVRVESGQVLFINSRRLHCSNPGLQSVWNYLCVRVNPSVFTTETQLGVEYFERKFGANSVDFMLLDMSEDWHREVVDRLMTVRDKMKNAADRPLAVIGSALELIDRFGEHITDAAFADNTNRDYGIFLDMVEYIRDHYAEKIKTDDIASAGRVSRARVFQLFERYAHISPNTYIINYRITKSCELLRNSDMSIMEISEMCGFQTSSYFSRVFCKEKGITPREYRSSVRR